MNTVPNEDKKAVFDPMKYSLVEQSFFQIITLIKA